ncbi:MAG TPA: hypothetical protein VIA63_09630 [Candidatus Limnocylindria bacterium]|jgi:hypothetical protein
MGEGLIEFLCVDPSHEPHLSALSGYVTIVERAWAYCPRGAATPHDWRPIPPIALPELVKLGLGTVAQAIRDARSTDQPPASASAAASS